MQKVNSEISSNYSRQLIVPSCIVLVAAIFLVADRIMKSLALAQWTDRHVELFPGVQLTFLLNKGIALSVPLTGTVGLVLILLLFCALLVWFVLSIRRQQWLRASLLLVILLGAGSNIVDRFLYGGVVDYLQIVFPSVINLADVMVVGGVVGLFLSSKHRTTAAISTPSQ